MPEPTPPDHTPEEPRLTPPVGPAESNELPSLLSLFEQPVAPATGPILPAAAPGPPPMPAPAPPAGASAADIAARQQAEQLVAQLRRQAIPPPPVPVAPAATSPASVSAAPPARPPMPQPPAPAPAAILPPQAAPRRSNGLLIGLLVVGLLVLAALSYLALRRPADAVPVAATSTAADTTQAVATQPLEVAPAPAPVIVRETVRVAVPTPVAPVASVPADSLDVSSNRLAAPADATTQPAAEAAPDSEPVPAAPEADDDEATRQVREKLAAYYADLYEPPLHAANYFAPQVERLYIQRNLTPDQIDAELARSFFPDNRHAAYQVEPGTLRVSEPAADGSRTATYTEAVRLFRVSRGQHQRLRTQVRVRFNADGQIVFMRQEKLLSNVFEP